MSDPTLITLILIVPLHVEGKKEELVKALNTDQEDSDMIKTIHLDDNKQADVHAGSVGDKMRTVGVINKNKLTMITVKGTYTILVSE